MKSPTYTRKAYIQFAELISKLHWSKREKEIQKMVKLFAADNPRFDETRFRDACNP